MEKIHGFRTYHENDPGFAEKLREAKNSGVQVLAYRCVVDRERIRVVEEVLWDNRTEDV